MMSRALLAAAALSTVANALPSSTFQGAHCAGAKDTCYKNSEHVMSTNEVADSAACCAACTADQQCKSFTAWNVSDPETNTTALYCNLFSSVSVRKQGKCVSGEIVGR